MNSLQDILAIYDNPEEKGFEYYDVNDAIKQLPEEVVKSDAAQYEMLAMLFSEGSSDEWGTYFGPMLTGKAQDGTPVYFPDRKSLTPNCIAHWERRATDTRNPYIRMRYAGLVNEFKKEVTNVEPDYRTIKLPYVESIVEVIEGGYCHHAILNFMLIERALSCAKSWHNEKLIDRVKETFFKLDVQYRDELETPGYWAKVMELVTRNRDVFTNEEQHAILTENEERYALLMDLCKKKGAETDRYVHILHDETELLCEYYEKEGDRTKISEHIGGLLESIRISADLRGSMWYHGMLTQVQALYRKYHLYKEANRLYVDIQAIGSRVVGEMHKFEVSVPITQSMVDRYTAGVLKGKPDEVIARFIAENTPNVASEKQLQLEEAKQAPLLSLIPTTIYDINGNPQVRYSAGDDGEENRFMDGLWRHMLSTAVLLRLQIQAMEKEEILTFDAVMNEFENVPFVPEGHKEILELGVKAYFAEDMLMACHLIIPQFEAMIRQIVALKGGDILRASSDANDGDEYKSLEGLLNSEEIKDAFTEDEIVYFKNIFTAKAGANFRNSLSHGLMPINYFNHTMADRVMHALMVLSKAKI